MPTYQYACTNADGKHEFEVVQSFTDAPVSECTVCGSPVRKVYGSVGVVFKGSGFYRTDSRAGASKGSSNGSSGKGSPAKESGDSAAKTSPAKETSSSGSSSTAAKAAAN